MCINSIAGTYRMAKFCKSALPNELIEAMEQVNQDDSDAVKAFGIEQGIKVSKELLDFGVQGLHYYTLNLEKVVRGIVDGIQPYLQGDMAARSVPSLIAEGSQISVDQNLLKTDIHTTTLNETISKSTKIE